MCAALVVAVTGAVSCGDSENESGNRSVETVPQYTRIVSTAPNITETLYALGLGDRVVGVTSFCRYPPEARTKPNIGGFLDTNYEALATLEPDLVLCLPEHETIRNYLDELDIPYEIVGNRTVTEILETITTIGKLCGAGQAADSLIGDIRGRIDAVQRNVPDGNRLRILLSIGRSLGGESLEEVYAAGRNTFYDELITIAGGENAIADSDAAYPLLTAESLLYLDPDIIVDLVPDLETSGLTAADVRAQWKTVPRLSPAHNERVYVISADYTVIPGPRFILLLEDLARILDSDSASHQH